jgi:hypothetical protein
MAQSTLAQALDIVRRLDKDELLELQIAVEHRLTQPGGASALSQFYRAVERAGLVKQIRKPSADSRSERPLVAIQGKPLSATIVEDRR